MSTRWNYAWSYVFAVISAICALEVAVSRIHYSHRVVACALVSVVTLVLSVVFCRRVFMARSITGEDKTGPAGFLMIMYFGLFGWWGIFALFGLLWLLS